MRELKLTAVGSSRLIADEIKEITEAFLGVEFPVATSTVDEISEARPDTFYICASTQREALSRVIPKDSLFVFKLHPTTLFFLAIAKIPAGTDVYVFNNLRPYIELLSKECGELGINALQFHPIPYAEIPDAEVRERLRKARYIIGVDCMVGEKVLLSEMYRSELRPDVKIIAGKRAASIASASRLLEGIVSFYCEALTEANSAAETAEAQEKMQSLPLEAEHLLDLLKDASTRIVTSQIGGATFASSEPFVVEESADAGEKTLQGQIDALRYLQKKLRQLSA